MRSSVVLLAKKRTDRCKPVKMIVVRMRYCAQEGDSLG